MLEYVPRQFALRPIQREILSAIDEKIKSGYRRIVLCAPTGVGKSLVGVTAARCFGSSFIVTASKNLQNQYVQDFGFLRPVKGKSNFACHLIMADKKIDDPKYAERAGMTCEKGQCTTRRVTDGRVKYEVCRFKPTVQDVQKGSCSNDACLYYLQKYTGLVSAHSLWNYSSFFQIMKFGKEAFAPYLGRPIAIFDEAHTIEEQIVQFVGYDIRRRHLEDARINIERYDLGDIDDVLRVISDIAVHYAERIRDVEDADEPRYHPEYGGLGRLQSTYEMAAQARIDIEQDRENFVANKPEIDTDGRIKLISIKPVDISGFAGEFFDAKYNIFMSATIDKPSFCENMGIALDDVAMVDTPRSPFPAESRAVELLRVRHLNYRSTPGDEAAVINAIDGIMDKFRDRRGLVLTSSVARCYRILDGLSERNKRRMRICHSQNPNGKTQNEVIAEHQSDPHSVLLSSSLWEGVDLKDDMSRFQIIAKVPYPNYSENRTRAKMAKFPRWYEARTLTKLLQGMGRSVRNENDWATTYVLDAAVDKLLRRRDMIPMSYRDVLGMGSNGGGSRYGRSGIRPQTM